MIYTYLISYCPSYLRLNIRSKQTATVSFESVSSNRQVGTYCYILNNSEHCNSRGLNSW
jgi:hypothetical protein